MFNTSLISPGLDPDAWRLLNTARYIAEHHVYVASRLPGYPVPEFAYSVFSGSPVWIAIALTLLISLLGFVSYYKTLRAIGISEAFLLTLAFACTPVVLINCFTTMDYMWGISFVLLAILSSLNRKIVLSGIFLGIAIGCRITSALMVAPIVFILYSSQKDKRKNLKEISIYLFAAATSAFFCYVPVLLEYGASFLKYAKQNFPSLVILGKIMTVDTFGIIGTIGIVVAILFQVLTKRSPVLNRSPASQQWKTICWIAIGSYCILFALLPLDAGYLIPIVPFLLLLLNLYLSKIPFRMIALAIMLSPFLLGMDTKDRPWSAPLSPVSLSMNLAGRQLGLDFLYGPFALDFRKRQSQQWYANSVLSWAQSHRVDKIVIVSGVWLPTLSYLAHTPSTNDVEETFVVGNVMVTGLVSKRIADELMFKGFQFYYLPGQDRYDYEVYGVVLGQFRAEPLELGRSIP